MSFDICQLAQNHGFDRAYLVPKLFLEDASFFGLKNLADIMEDAQSVLLVLKKHNPYKPFPKGTMSIHSHYPAYQKAYFLHKSLIEKLNAIGVKAKSADMVSIKEYADAAGLSRLKNTLSYHEDFGSYFVMQAIAVDEKGEKAVKYGKDMCKSCTKCIKACPTGALLPEGGIDRTKCIRHHVPVGEFIPEEIRRANKSGYIGCGICQSVCPLNHDVKRVQPPQEILDPLNICSILDLGTDSEAIKKLQVIIGKNEARPGRTIATACMAAGNTGSKKYIPYLKEVLIQYINPLGRGYAAWALGRIGGSRMFLEEALKKEHNTQAKVEILAAIHK
jgi:epoxyqueuosine reductase